MFPTIGEAFTVLDVANPIRLSFDVSATADQVVNSFGDFEHETGIELMGYSVSAVKQREQLAGVIEYGTALQLTAEGEPNETISQHYLALSEISIVSASLPLAEAPAAFKSVSGPVVILQGSELSHYVYWLGMIDTLIFRYLLLGLLLEMEHLLRQVFVNVSDDQITKALPERRVSRLARFRDRALEKHSGHHFARPTLIDQASLKDLARLSQTIPSTRELIPFTDQLPIDKFFSLSREVRNRLAHGLRIWDLYAGGPSSFLPLYTELQLMVNSLNEIVAKDRGYLS